MKHLGLATRIFISGPYTLGDVAENVANAIDAATQLLDAGFYPYVPHLTHFWHLQHQRDYETWMELDEVWLRQCDYMLILPGESKGVEREIEVARQLRIPCFDSIKELLLIAASRDPLDSPEAGG